MLVEIFHWSLDQIDHTDIESLIPFVFRYPRWKIERAGNGTGKTAYADQISWM